MGRGLGWGRKGSLVQQWYNILPFSYPKKCRFFPKNWPVFDVRIFAKINFWEGGLKGENLGNPGYFFKHAMSLLSQWKGQDLLHS